MHCSGKSRRFVAQSGSQDARTELGRRACHDYHVLYSLASNITVKNFDVWGGCCTFGEAVMQSLICPAKDGAAANNKTQTSNNTTRTMHSSNMSDITIIIFLGIASLMHSLSDGRMNQHNCRRSQYCTIVFQGKCSLRQWVYRQR